MTLPIPTRIKAVREDPAAPLAECYPDLTPTALAKIFASQSTPLTIQPKEITTMGYNETSNFTGAAPAKVEKNLAYVHGINANNNPARLIDTLHRLGLVSDSMAASLTTLAAAEKPLGEYFKVSVYALDAKLRQTEASIENRLAFKSSLDRAGLLTVPR